MALYLTETNALFLHIPKTGGTWVERALERCGIATEHAEPEKTATIRHGLLYHFKRTSSFTFTFVRHPLSWYESWWKYQAGLWQTFEPGVWHPQRVLEDCASDNFSEFIQKCIQHEPAYVSRMYEWYIGPPHWSAVDFVGRCERLREDLGTVLRTLGYEFDQQTLDSTPRAHVSSKQCGEPHWSAELKYQMEQLEAPAIRRFYSDFQWRANISG